MTDTEKEQLFRFCPKCGSAFEERIIEAEHPPRLVCSQEQCRFVFYRNSVPVTIGVISDGERILLSKRNIPPKVGQWSLPGGFLEYGEEPWEGLRREVMEELGAEMGALEFLDMFVDVYSLNGSYVLAIVYAASLTDGPRLAASSEVSEWRWFAPREIPDLPFRANAQAINAWLEKIGQKEYSINLEKYNNFELRNIKNT